MYRQIKFVLPGVVALFVISFISSSKAQPGPGKPAAEAIAVQVEVVTAEKLGDRVTAVGTLLPNEEVEIRSEISGKVEQIRFKEGSRVQKGEVLFKINDAELQAQLARAQSRQLIAAQQAERQRQLFEKGLTSKEDFDNAVNELNVIKAEQQLIQAQLAKTEVRAPFGGKVGLRYISEGSYISPTTRITILQDNTRTKLDFTVPEKYAAALHIGDKVNFTVQGNTAQFDGQIYALETKIDSATRTRRVRAMCPNPKDILIPGAFAEVELMLQQRESLTIPAYALIPDLKGQRVFICKDGKAASRQVQTGARSDTRVEITQGLSAGDSLLISAILQLRPGMAVHPVVKQ